MTQYTMDQVAKLGLIKFDFLGLKTLTVIQGTINLIKETTGEIANLDEIGTEDEKTFKLISKGKTTGVFQLESAGMKEILRSLKPNVFEDIVATVALYRPGPLGSNMVNDFIKRKHGEIEITYLLPQLEGILKETYGVIVYQEQVMRIAQVLANYSLGEADLLRKAISKKQPEDMARQKKRFIEGADENNIDLKKAGRVYELIEKFGGYGFNKSHSVAYAMIAYWTAYLKAHYPVQFMAALLTEDMGNQDKTIKNIAECKEMGIPILPPDINESQADFSVAGESIRFGLAAVKNVGLKAVEEITHEREENGSFESLLSFCKRLDKSKVNKRVLEGLIQCGAFDFEGVFRSRLFASLGDILASTGINENPNQLNIFDLIPSKQEIVRKEFMDIAEWEEDDRLRREKESLGFYITGHPLDKFEEEVRQFATTSSQELIKIKEDKKTVKFACLVNSIKIKMTRRKEKMALIVAEDKKGFVEATVFPDVFARCAPLLNDDRPLLITGETEVGENQVKIICQNIVSLEAAKKKTIKSILIPVSKERLSHSSLMKLRDLIFRHPGDCRLKFRIDIDQDNSTTVIAHNRYNVMPEENLLQEMSSLVGDKLMYDV